MNRLDVFAYGVEEMKREDLKHVNGGIMPWIAMLIVKATLSNSRTLHKS